MTELDRFIWGRSERVEMLKLADIHTYYGESYILQGVSLSVGEGRVVGLFGRNGAGKTTTIRSIIGFTPARRGKVYFKGQDVTNMSSHTIVQMGIGLVPQGRRIFSSLSVEENLRLAERKGEWDIEKAYSFLPILGERRKHKGNQLSGGEQQMLAIARALVLNPDLLLLDESTAGLAPLLIEQIGGIVQQLRTQGFSILLVEENLSTALKIVDYAYILSRGKIVYESKPEDLRKNHEIQAAYLGVSS